MPDDIRDVPTEEYWERFEKKWTGLLSYRYLGRRHGVLDTGVERETMVLRSDMRNPAGGIMAAPLCIASPESGGMADDLFVPNPVIASMQVIDDARDVREIEILRETIRVGRQMGFSRSKIVDADNPDRLIALSEGSGVSIGQPPPGFEHVDNPVIDVVDSPSLPPLHVAFGAQRRAPGVWELPELSDELSSPDAALHLGPIHVVFEAAAMDLVAHEADRRGAGRGLARDVRRAREGRALPCERRGHHRHRWANRVSPVAARRRQRGSRDHIRVSGVSDLAVG